MNGLIMTFRFLDAWDDENLLNRHDLLLTNVDYFSQKEGSPDGKHSLKTLQRMADQLLGVDRKGAALISSPRISPEVSMSPKTKQSLDFRLNFCRSEEEVNYARNILNGLSMRGISVRCPEMSIEKADWIKV